MLYVGTSNPGKLREIEQILAPLGVALGTVDLDVPEPHDTFVANATDKALAHAAHAGGVALAEDSGIVVPALGGLPGVWSARFADLDLAARVVHSSGRARSVIDPLNTARLLELMRDKTQPAERAAYYHAVIVVARPGEVLFTASGECHGTLATEPRGTGGFGYDPVFVGEDTGGRTFAEITPAEKNARSHRRRALEQVLAWAQAHPGVVA